MTRRLVLVTVAALLAAAPAAAQLSNRSIALETPFSAALRAPGGLRPGLALVVSAWLDGDLDATARVCWTSAAEPPGRAPSSALVGTAGLRLSLLPDPLRPQLWADVGWARVARDGAAEDRLAFGVGAGLEWFPARDVSVAARAGVRGVGASTSGEVALAFGAYF